ncbi:hypothetical protein Hanom_Chr16g01420751 [Helianthus anomalus]
MFRSTHKYSRRVQIHMYDTIFVFGSPKIFGFGSDEPTNTTRLTPLKASKRE